MSDVKNPSQTIAEFLEFLENAKSEYEKADQDVETRNKKNIDFLHDMEFAKNKNERNRIATQIKNNQIARRKSKDKKIAYEPVNKFMNDAGFKPLLSKLRTLASALAKNENYLETDRQYNRRVKDE